MDFDWNSKEKRLKDSVAAVFGQAELSEATTLGDNDLPELKSITTRFLRRLAEVEYLSLGVGPANRAETMQLLAAQEELARISGSLFLAVETTARLFGGLLAGFADLPCVRDIHDELALGNLIAGVALSEPETGDSENPFATAAEHDGRDFIVSGKKSFSANAPIADLVAVQGTIDGAPAFFLVEAGHPGVTVGPRLKTVGYDGLAAAAIELHQVRVSPSRVLGPFPDRSPLQFLRTVHDMILSTASVGLMSRVIKVSKDHCQSHIRGGRPVFRFQELRFKLAEMETLLQTAQLINYRADWLYAVNDPEAPTMRHCAKVFCSEAAERVASLGLQIMAGHGYVCGNPVERGYRSAKFAQIAGTTSEVARMAIADDLLSRYQV